MEDEIQGEPTEDDVAFVGDFWDEHDPPLDDNDPDAIVCLQFEDSLVEALQSDGELAACYNTYLDARKRLTDRNKNRGFWGNSKGFSGNVKGKGKGKGKWGSRFRKPLAQRILESECRRCGQKGHWKAECPLARTSGAASNSQSKDHSAFAGTLDVIDGAADSDMILVATSDEVPCDVPTMHSTCHACFMGISYRSGDNHKPQMSGPMLSRFVSTLKSLLSPHPEKPIEPSASVNQPSSLPAVPPEESQVQKGSENHAMFVSHGPFGIMDLGASQTVIGRQQVPELLKHLPVAVAAQVQKVPCQTIFRFGNSSTVSCREALLIPLNQWNVKICVVDTKTPFLLSNNVFRTLGAQIDTAQDTVFFSKIHVTLPLMLTEKKLYLVDFCELIRQAQCPMSQVSKSDQSHVRPVMSTVADVPEPHDDAVSENQNASSQSLCDRSSDLGHPQCTTEIVPVQPDSSSHGVDVPGRSFPGRDSSCKDRGISEEVLRRSGQDDHCLRRIQGGANVSRSDSDRSQVCSMVHSKIWGESERDPPSLPVLHQSVCGERN